MTTTAVNVNSSSPTVVTASSLSSNPWCDTAFAICHFLAQAFWPRVPGSTLDQHPVIAPAPVNAAVAFDKVVCVRKEIADLAHFVAIRTGAPPSKQDCIESCNSEKKCAQQQLQYMAAFQFDRAAASVIVGL